ncbi:protein N-lysine methyltransferase METTL21D-like [Hydractinia symbiolongicarpus]|uniref:protein N-lysine methyltransferase METTL21D-like n=1 Tax=Hydractinia symbiolongicarpus TaxID=13093 RepID=UPI0025504923|nr:protein N-lysine methyltransferase METTL21D-like [Hydractinia symbiolongicarpus]
MSLSEYFIREVDYSTGKMDIYQATIGDVGYVVWDAALVLSKFIDGSYCKSIFPLDGKNVIELGAGTGIVGMVAATLGAFVKVTDLDELVPLMTKNITENKLQNIKACELTWDKELHFHEKFDYIFVADCIYYDKSLKPLVETMNKLCTSSTIIFLSYEERHTEHKIKLQKDFFELASKYFNIEEIPASYQDSVFRSDDIHIFKMTSLG